MKQVRLCLHKLWNMQYSGFLAPCESLLHLIWFRSFSSTRTFNCVMVARPGSTYSGTSRVIRGGLAGFRWPEGMHHSEMQQLPR